MGAYAVPESPYRDLVTKVGSVTHQTQEFGLFICNPSRQQSLSFGVDDQAMVVSSSDIDAGPDLRHKYLRSFDTHIRPADDHADVVLHSDLLAHPN